MAERAEHRAGRGRAPPPGYPERPGRGPGRLLPNFAFPNSAFLSLLHRPSFVQHRSPRPLPGSIPDQLLISDRFLIVPETENRFQTLRRPKPSPRAVLPSSFSLPSRSPTFLASAASRPQNIAPPPRGACGNGPGRHGRWEACRSPASERGRSARCSAVFVGFLASGRPAAAPRRERSRGTRIVPNGRRPEFVPKTNSEPRRCGPKDAVLRNPRGATYGALQGPYGPIWGL